MPEVTLPKAINKDQVIVIKQSPSGEALTVNVPPGYEMVFRAIGLPTLFITVFEHERGTDVNAFFTEAEANRHRITTAKDCWSDFMEEAIPDPFNEGHADQYWDEWENSDHIEKQWFEIREIEIPTA